MDILDIALAILMCSPVIMIVGFIIIAVIESLKGKDKNND